jgi:predicted N-acetyltransferase YhbS
MTDAELMHQADLDFYRSNALFMTSTPVGEVTDSRDLVLVNCGAPFPQFNQAILKPALLDLDAAIERGETYFAERQLPFRFTVRSDVAERCAQRLLDAGYGEAAPLPAMVLRKIPPAPAAPSELEIRVVRSPTDVEQFRGVAERGFGMPTGMGTVALSDAVVAHPDTELYLGCVDAVPVATALLQMSNRVAGLYFVACEADRRRKGYGEAVTWAALSGGAERGASLASLQASDMGRPVYARMGFDLLFHYHGYVSPGADTTNAFAG